VFSIVLKMSNFVPNSHHLREVLLFAFHWKKNATEAQRMLAEVYGKHALSERAVRDWFQR